MSTPITAEQLIDLIAAASITRDVCVRSTDWDRRGGDWTEERIVYIDPNDLIQALKNFIPDAVQ